MLCSPTLLHALTTSICFLQADGVFLSFPSSGSDGNTQAPSGTAGVIWPQLALEASRQAMCLPHFPARGKGNAQVPWTQGSLSERPKSTLLFLTGCTLPHNRRLLPPHCLAAPFIHLYAQSEVTFDQNH